MRFIECGPDFPPDVLHALEDGKLIFYCGAGVSMGAGFPSFEGLVDGVYAQLNQERNGLEQSAQHQKLFDRVLGLLENRIESRATVCQAVRAVLGEPSRENFPVHEAILKLSSDRYGEQPPRLVTTNFDNLFDRAADNLGITLNRHSAPALPIPKLSGWQSLVYLHGALEPPEQEQLVYTSADFGKAYLTEAWAARFVSTLFQNFTVLFVGYSIEDPVLRYMMDALASERLDSSEFGKAFALADISSQDQAEKKKSEWRAKGVVPILYLAPEDNHGSLNESLELWAKQWVGSLEARTRLATNLGRCEPSNLTAEERSQFDWALLDRTAFRAFCSLGKRAPLAWLDQLAYGCSEDQLNELGIWASTHLQNTDLVRVFCDFLGRVNETPHHLVVLDALRKAISTSLARGDHGLSKQHQQQWLLLTHSESPAYDDCIENLLQCFPTSIACFREGITIFPMPEVESTITGLRCRLEFRPGLAHHLSATFSELPDAKRAELAFVLTNQLHRCIEFLQMTGSARPGFDISTSYRASIRPDNQNFTSRDWRILIDFTRLAAEALDAIDRERVRGLVALWQSLDSPLFDRLALHIVGQSSHWTLGEKLEFIQ